MPMCTCVQWVILIRESQASNGKKRPGMVSSREIEQGMGGAMVTEQGMGTEQGIAGWSLGWEDAPPPPPACSLPQPLKPSSGEPEPSCLFHRT